MKKLMIAAAALAMAGSAHAADLAVKAPLYKAPVSYDWTGVYIGGNVGWASGKDSWCTDATTNNCGITNVDTVSQKTNGAIGGGQFGARYQYGKFVFGVEGMFDALGLSETSPSPVNAGRVRTAAFSSLFSGTGSVGYAWDRALIYGKGGFASTGIKFDALNTQAGGLDANASTTALGWTAGAGLEYLVLPNVSVGVEYNYYQFDVPNITNVLNSGGNNIPNLAAGVNASVQTVTGRVNVKIDSWFK